MLEFDADKHEYRLDGIVLPSVTQIIRAVLPGWQASEFYLSRGRAMHHGCRLLDEGRLDWATVSPEIEGRVKAWQRFRADATDAKPIEIEKPLASERLRFAGTLDRIFEEDGRLCVCDLKSTIEPQVAVQCGAYSLLYYEHQKRRPQGAVAVELRDDGTYRAKWISTHELRRAEQVFLACLTVFGFMSANKLRGNNERSTDSSAA